MCAVQNNLSAYNNITYVPEGLWGKRGKLAFSASGTTASRLADYGNVCVDVTSIDDLLDGKPVTFIKMDIEGAEIEALKGAAKSIKKYKPKLAICAYHEMGDFIEIPMLINELNPGYRLYLRHYSPGRRNTVCYAV
jgi:FkbM family methyltransferase